MTILENFKPLALGFAMVTNSGNGGIRVPDEGQDASLRLRQGTEPVLRWALVRCRKPSHR
jgi:hypothetical protein